MFLPPHALQRSVQAHLALQHAYTPLGALAVQPFVLFLGAHLHPLSKEVPQRIRKDDEYMG